MFRALAAIALSVALAASPMGARPAQALDDKEILGLLAGFAALAIIKKELDDRKDERRAAQVHRQAPRHSDTWRYRDRTLPGQCQFRLENREGRLLNVLGPRCLERNGVRLSRLPSNCLRDVRTTRGFRPAYGLRCIKREGWALDGTRRIGN